MVEGKTRPQSCHRGPASSRSSSWRTLRALSAATIDAGRADGPPAPFRLRFRERRPAVDALHGVADPKRPGGEVDVLPTQPQRLALPQPERDGHGVVGLQPVAFDDFEEGPRVLGAEGATLRPAGARWVNQGRHVAGHEAPPERLTERVTEDGAEIP